MIVVVEPGVAIKWFVEEPLRPQARSLLVNGHELIAPDILIAGVAELAWKKTIAGDIAPDQAEPIVRCIALPSFISAFVESTRLRNRALALALQCGRPVHECFYAACAEAAFAPLVSSDETFLQALRCEGIAVRGIPLARIHELDAVIPSAARDL
jgi:predicted nucleic acid-binding protein